MRRFQSVRPLKRRRRCWRYAAGVAAGVCRLERRATLRATVSLTRSDKQIVGGSGPSPAFTLKVAGSPVCPRPARRRAVVTVSAKETSPASPHFPLPGVLCLHASSAGSAGPSGAGYGEVTGYHPCSLPLPCLILLFLVELGIFGDVRA